MKILQVVPSLDVGGAERLASLLAIRLRGLGDDVSVVSLFDPVGSWIEQELNDAGVETHFLAKRPGFDPRMIPRLAALFARTKPNIVHTHLHTIKYTFPASFAWRRCRQVHTVHNLAQHEIERAGRAVHRVAFRCGVAPVAIGDAVAASIQDVYGLSAAATIPNGIVVKDYQKGSEVRGRMRAELGVDHDEVVVIHAGRLSPQKNQAALIDTFAASKALSGRGRLFLVGEGELRESLTRQAQQSGVADRVTFLGLRSDIPDLFAAADIFALPSIYEGNPLVVMEAMAAGLPVIAAAVGSIPELIPPGTGVLIPPNEPALLRRELERLANDPVLRADLGAAGQRNAEARFDVGAMAVAYAALYRAILQPTSVAGSPA